MIGSLSASIERGLNDQGQPLLGGDVEFSLIHREATDKEFAFIAMNGEVSKVATLRAMAVAPETTTLVEIKATDTVLSALRRGHSRKRNSSPDRNCVAK